MNDTKRNEQRSLKVGVGSHESIKKRILAAARGEKPIEPGFPKIWFISVDDLFRVLTPENREMMAIISRECPWSVSVLAERLGRDQGNVSRALSVLEEYGFVRLTREGGRSDLRLLSRKLISTSILHGSR